MAIRLHPDWRNILRLAWSVRVMALSAVLSGVGYGLMVAQPYLGWNPIYVAIAVGVATTGSALVAIWARVLDQGGISATDRP